MSESVTRVVAFAVTFGALLVAERFRPFRVPRPGGQWRVNVGLFATNTLLVRLVPGASLTALAAGLQSRGLGAFALVDWPAGVEFAIAVIALDLSMYVQHRLFHALPWLWRFHAVHHSDVFFDVTTGLRFHLGEMLASLAMKAATIVALGPSPVAVIAFEVLLNCGSMFTHANVALPRGVDALLRRFVVTPNMHRVHHSIEYDEHECNFGFLIVWWDRWFGSYREATRNPPASMDIGLPQHRSETAQRLLALLRQPIAQTES